MDETVYGHDLLERTAASLAYPPTPQVRARVLAAIAEAATPPVARWRMPSLPALAAAAVVIAAGMAVSLSVPSSRETIADFFGIEGSEVEIVPTPAPATTPTPFPTPHDIDADAVPSTLEKAAAISGFEAALPAGEAPVAVYTVRYGGSTAVILRYPEFDLWQIDGAGDFEGIVGKQVPATAKITDLTVSGVPARWISDGPHVVQFVDGQGIEIGPSFRVVERNTLIWRTAAALYRIETLLPLDEARSIAESLP